MSDEMDELQERALEDLEMMLERWGSPEIIVITFPDAGEDEN